MSFGIKLSVRVWIIYIPVSSVLKRSGIPKSFPLNKLKNGLIDPLYTFRGQSGGVGAGGGGGEVGSNPGFIRSL